ncbi:hypothetical protein KKB40_03745, partial [Patescibacteria group bacterium]|nr:hypothetical protein [Patescibacteria group bacterium]
IRENSLKEEVSSIKREVDGSFDVKLVCESKIKVSGFDAVKLDYEPVEKGELEARSFVIINNGKYSISISTTPEQIGTIIFSFKFL